MKRAHGPDANEIRRNVKARTSSYDGPAEGTGPLADLLPELRNVLWGALTLQSRGRIASTCRGFYTELVATPTCRLWMPEKWRSRVTAKEKLEENAKLCRLAAQRVIEEKIRPSKLFETVKNVSGLLDLNVYGYGGGEVRDGYDVVVRLADSIIRGPRITAVRYTIASGVDRTIKCGVDEAEHLRAIIATLQGINDQRATKRATAHAERKKIPAQLRKRLAAAEKELRSLLVDARKFFNLKYKDFFLKYEKQTLAAVDAFKANLVRINPLKAEIAAIKSDIAAVRAAAAPAEEEEEEEDVEKDIMELSDT